MRRVAAPGTIAADRPRGGAGAPGAPRHVVLVGLPGAGKSTVGPRVASALARPFLDLDAELERRVGLSIAEQFARDGEAVFRMREAELSLEIADAGAMVLAPGGGWLANAAAAATLRPVGRIIYLRTSPRAAHARLGAAVAARPLLAAASDPEAALAGLLARRAAIYESADAIVDTDELTAEAVSAAVVERVRAWEEGEWPQRS